MMAANTQVAAALQNVLSVSDQFPRPAADAHYQGLRQNLIRLEEKITASRKFYNLAVEEANAVRRSFPANLLARRSPGTEREKFSPGERRVAIELTALYLLACQIASTCGKRMNSTRLPSATDPSGA